MFGLKREWTPVEADEWTREDIIAGLCAAVSFILVGFGAAYGFLLEPVGFVLFGAGLGLFFWTLWMITPKLSAVSREYEKKQRKYMEELDRIMRWEEEPE